MSWGHGMAMADEDMVLGLQLRASISSRWGEEGVGRLGNRFVRQHLSNLILLGSYRIGSQCHAAVALGIHGISIWSCTSNQDISMCR